MNFSKQLLEKAGIAEHKVSGAFSRICGIAAKNQFKVVSAMQGARVSDSHFAGTTGYGYNDAGRDALEKAFASAFKAEDALVRQQIATGTHAIGLCLYGNLRPGDELLSATGKPYDTVAAVIGAQKIASAIGAQKQAKQGNTGTLRDYGVTYREASLAPDGTIDLNEIRKAVTPRTKVVLIQRSRGYAWRDALSIGDIERAIAVIKNIREGIIVVVDNCYGEFVEEREPVEAGADLVAGSLIKNPGGGLAPSGGYVAGAAEYVRNAAYRLTVPGIGGEVGATLNNNRSLFQGFYMAPHTVAESLKGAAFLAALMEPEGYRVSPSADAPRYDIIQAVELGTSERLKAFCRGIQKGSAVDSFVTPEPWLMPGYEHEVIMAAGTFVQGASIELSADGPMIDPYIAYVQGGLVYEGAKIGYLSALSELDKNT